MYGEDADGEVNSRQRNPQLPWVVGVVIVAIVDVYIGYLFFATGCEAPDIAQTLVLIVLPVVYLMLMDLTPKSQP